VRKNYITDTDSFGITRIDYFASGLYNIEWTLI